MKQKLLLYLFFLLFPMSFSAFAREIPLEDQIVLEKFFRTLFEQSEFGFVYYQKKPVCGDGYWVVDPILPGFERHECNVYLKEGIRAWKRLNPATNNEYVLNICEVPNAFDENSRDIHFVHRQLFLDTLKKNIELFQYVIGPEVSPQRLLDKFEDPAQPIQEILKQDNTLIGIALGFGAQNSLTVSRMERLTKEFSSPEIPPLKPLITRLHLHNSRLALEVSPHTSNKKHLLLSDKVTTTGQKELKPSFGFDSIAQEYQALSQKIIVSSEKLEGEHPVFIFGRLKDDPESELLIQELETTQTKIQKLLQSPTFFPQILKAMTSEEISLQNSSSLSLLTFTSKEVQHLPAIIAESIFYLTHEEEGGFLEAFCRGMLDAENNRLLSSLDKRRSSPLFYDQHILRAFRKCKENLQQCEILFDELNRNPTYSSIEPKKLYYKISKPGHGSFLKNEKKVLLHYTLLSGPEEILLCETGESGISREMDLSECISGFHHGILGMQIGEKREIYIHPSLAYGIYTTLDKGQYLKATVELIEIYPNQKFTQIPPLEEINIESEIPKNLEETYKKGQRELGYNQGYQTWNHYKHCDLYTVEQVLGWINKLKNGKSLNFPSSIDSNRTINRLHWNLYSIKTLINPVVRK